mmetsp:Transcript_63616/g.103078  ORF Transcript_63616/g.103078 Transcript_63616/m.103078 type:complete len:95 (+) Transcript_63616:509-793(+)
MRPAAETLFGLVQSLELGRSEPGFAKISRADKHCLANVSPQMLREDGMQPLYEQDGGARRSSSLRRLAVAAATFKSSRGTVCAMGNLASYGWFQ